MLNYLIIIIGIGIIFGIVIALTFLIKKIKPKGTLKKFLILTGASIFGFFIFILLHNLTSALLSYFLKREFEEPIFFILATIFCPLGLIVGIIGTIVQIIKRKTRI